MGEKLGLYRPPDGLEPAIWEKEELFEKTRRQLGLIHHRDQRVYEELRERVGLYAAKVGKDVRPILETIEKLRKTMKEEVDFTKIVLGGILFDWVRWNRDNPQLAEELERERLMKKEGNIPLSELMYANYAPSEPTILQIHIAPGETLRETGIMRSLIQGLRALQTLVRGNSNIHEITATSWIVAKYPGIFMDLGFTVGQAEEDVILKEFSDEIRPILQATITREKLLVARNSNS